MRPGSSREQRPAATPRASTRLVNLFDGRNARVLLVEDNAINQHVAAGILRKLGVRVDLASSGIEALGAVAEVAYDLVFMDLQMPGMDGFEAARHVRGLGNANRTTARVPIIALTASAMAGDREMCLKAGMDDYISKPVSAQVLAGVLSKWLPKEPEASTQANGGVFDKNAMVGRLMGNSVLATSVLRTFLKDMPKRLVAIREHAARGDLQSATDEAHGIKGGSAQIGGDSLAALALTVENACEAGDLPAVLAGIPLLEAEFGRLRLAISKEIDGPGA